MTFQEIKETGFAFWNQLKPEQKVNISEILLSEDKTKLKIRKLKRNIPLSVLSRLGPLIGKEKTKNV